MRTATFRKRRNRIIRHEASPLTAPGPGVLILARLPSVREGLRILLDSEGFRPAHTAGSAAEALPQVLSLRPDVAVVDIRLEDSTAVEFCRAARSLLPSLQFLLLACCEDDLSFREAVLAGASGLMLRQLRSDVLVSTVRRTADGNSLINATIRAQVIHDFSAAAATVDGQPRPVTSSPLNLAPAERDLLHLLAHGRDNECISQALAIPLKTVPALVRTALSKLGIDPQPHPRNHSQMNNDDARQEVAGHHRDVPPRRVRTEARPHLELGGPLRNPLPSPHRVAE